MISLSSTCNLCRSPDLGQSRIDRRFAVPRTARSPRPREPVIHTRRPDRQPGLPALNYQQQLVGHLPNASCSIRKVSAQASVHRRPEHGAARHSQSSPQRKFAASRVCLSPGPTRPLTVCAAGDATASLGADTDPQPPPLGAPYFRAGLHSVRKALEWWDYKKCKPTGPASVRQSQAEVNRDNQVARLGVVLRQCWKLAAPDRKLLVIAFMLLLGASLTELGMPWLLSSALLAASQGPAGAPAFAHCVKLFGALTLAYGVLSGLRGWCFGILNERMVRRLRDGLYSTLITQEIGWLDTQETGQLTSRLNSDTYTVANLVGLNMNVMLRNGVQAIGGAILLCQLHLQLALATGGVVLCYMLLSVLYGRYNRRLAKAVQSAIASTNQVAEETLSRADSVRVFSAEEREQERYAAHSRHVYSLKLRRSAAWGLFHGTSSIMYNSTKLIALLVGGCALTTGSVAAAQLTTFVLYVDMLVSASLAVCEQWASIMEAIGAAERVLGLLDRPPARQLAQGRQLPSQGLSAQLAFEDVEFRYPARPEITALNGVSLELEAGTVTALVGGSGSGKSTVAALVQRLYDPDAGRVLLDGHPLTDLDAHWYRSLVGVVSQEPSLFPADVASNIRYGEASASDAEVEWAARLANAHNFIEALPQGYQTPIGEGRLSGGQKQRIAIARALIRRPRILILDEATSALDAASEASVQEALDSIIHSHAGGAGAAAEPPGPAQDPDDPVWWPPPTVLVIAHKLATVENADKIIVLDAGTVVETGVHDDLIAKRGRYHSLLVQQLGPACMAETCDAIFD